MLAHLFLYIIVDIKTVSECFGSSLIFIDFQFEFHLEMDERERERDIVSVANAYNGYCWRT